MVRPVGARGKCILIRIQYTIEHIVKGCKTLYVTWKIGKNNLTRFSLKHYYFIPRHTVKNLLTLVRVPLHYIYIYTNIYNK